ncbi:MAG TPA: sigma factor G inhibitor Gin [Bacillota bacterium]|nr:sigma factor G inhibitor Gin [Bacillota bacterium]
MAVEPAACILCRRPKQEDNRGLCVRGRFICPECEAKIIRLGRNDPDYEYYRSGLKKIWRRPGG